MSWTVSATANQHSSAFDHRSPLKPKRGKNTLITWLRWFDHTACRAHTHILKPLYFRLLMKVFYFLQLKSSVVCTGLAINSSDQTDSILLTTWRGFRRKYELEIFVKFTVVFCSQAKLAMRKIFWLISYRENQLKSALNSENQPVAAVALVMCKSDWRAWFIS